MFFSDRHGRKIYYEVHGSGEPLVLLHHGFGSLVMWSGIYPELVEAGWQVVVYDRPGYGRSTPGDDFDEFYRRDDFRSENVSVLRQLAGFLELSRFHLVGQCEGGVVAVDFAAACPGLVKTLVTSSTLCRAREPMAEFNRARFPRSFHDLEPEMQQKMVYWQGPDYAEKFYDLLWKYGGSYGLGRFDLRAVLERVTCPALVLYPDRSPLFEVEQGVEFYRHLPAGELAVLPKCGHNTYEQQPREYVRQIRRFIRRHSG
jgi:pimeloyl-ACP methyl ester carboxylesterase